LVVLAATIKRVSFQDEQQIKVKKDQNKDIELAAEDLRMATRHLGSVVGKVDVEEILGSIFKDFCIGK
jgi:tRNA U34 5-carboxymethylaminomethyl modifying GTPase MnmE/TrmE